MNEIENNLMTQLKKYKFAELYEMSSGISSKPEQACHGAPFVSFKTVFNNYFLPECLSELMDTSEEEQETYSVKEGDIFLTRTSETLDELGMSSVAYKDYPKATYSGFLKRLRPINTEITYPKFLAFYLRSNLFRKTMNNNAIMTLRASLNEQIFSYLDLVLPEYNQQKKIGDFLFSIYQKIELNNRINAELEAMAKLIYEYWFVQFDFPNQEGKPYKSSGGKMVWNEELKREVPVGWTVTTFKSFDLYQPATITEKEMSQNAKYFVFGANGIVGKYNRFNHENSEIVITCRGNSCGNIIRTLPKCWITGNAMVIKSKNPNIQSEFIYQSLHWTNIRKVITGSGQPQITRTNLETLNILIPTNSILDKYNNFTESIIKSKLRNIEENQHLSELRDWLLPILMNGQVKIN